METFFQKLRDIQKKERIDGPLSEIEDTFYDDASNYLQDLLKIVDDNPLSLEAYQLRDAQRITIEICERREFKILTTAISNVQKSHDLFKGHKKNSQLYEEIPANVTPEEAKLYNDLVDMIISHRENLMTEIIPGKRKSKRKLGFRSETKKSVETTEEEISSSEVEVKREFDKKSKPTTPQLDESQIALMFGQAPDMLLDENNNPVKTKPKTDITTPFTPPEVPLDDTVALQNIEDTHKNTHKVDNSIDENSHQSDQEQIEEQVVVNEVSDIEYDVEELVEFKKEITTDILDEDKKTYGPFSIQDVVLLPRSLVKILKLNDVIEIL